MIALIVSAGLASAAPKPQWTFAVPASATHPSSNWSSVSYAGSDAAGNTLLILRHATVPVIGATS